MLGTQERITFSLLGYYCRLTSQGKNKSSEFQLVFLL